MTSADERLPPSLRLERIGREAEPLVVIDNFSGTAPQLERIGRQADYRAVEGFPGIRSPADRRYLQPMSEMLGEIFAKAFGFKSAMIERCEYSIVTRQTHELSSEQRLPHYDSADDTVIALLHYLQGPDTGGTAFYRHRRTGFESLNPDRVAPYHAGLQQDETEYGPPAAAYTLGDSDRYEMTAEIEAKEDRAIIYRGRLLHSGVIPNPPTATTAQDTGRLTINTFILGQR